MFFHALDLQLTQLELMAIKGKYHIQSTLNDECTGTIFKHAGMVSQILQNWHGLDLIETIQPFRKNRSLAQNRYLYGVIIPVIKNHFKQNTGEDMDKGTIEVYLYENVLGHTLERRTMLGVEVFVAKGKKFKEMTTVEFNDAKEIIQEYFAQFECWIPDPREQNLLTDYI